MKILIVGAGAIGGSLACYLSSVGLHITILEKDENICSVINQEGMTLKDGEKEYKAKVRAVSQLSQSDHFDCCFVATRAYHLKSAVLSVLPNLSEDAFVISMNNGVCINPLIEAVGKKRAVWCSINYGAGISSPGKYYIKIRGGLIFGMKDGGVPSKLLRVLDVMRSAIQISVTSNILGTLYSKMLINSCITSTAIISGLSLGEILKGKRGKLIFTEIVREGLQMAEIAGISVPNYGKLNYRLFLSKSLTGKLYRLITFPVLRKKYGSRQSASLEALKRGAKTEISYFNGYVVHLANKFHRSAPVNQAIVKCVHAVEKDISYIGEERLDEIALIASTFGGNKN